MLSLNTSLIKKNFLEIRTYIEFFNTSYERLCERIVLLGECPHCKGRLIIHGYYERKLIDLDGNVISVTLCRVKCKRCNCTHTIMPDFILPYSRQDYFSILTLVTKHIKEKKSKYQLFVSQINMSYERVCSVINLYERSYEMFTYIYQFFDNFKHAYQIMVEKHSVAFMQSHASTKLHQS